MPHVEIDLSGRRALVTGGTRGLGREIVKGLAQAGADIVVVSRKQEACDEAAAAIRALGRKALPLACDVGNWDECGRLVESAYEQFGDIDILINNAGMSPVLSKPSDLTEEMFDKVFDVNLKGLYRLSALIGERMAEGEGGSIVNVSSTAAVLEPAPVAPYAAIKAGVNTLTKAMARAYGPKVRVNAVMCGPFRTDLTKAFIDHPTFLKQVERNTPLKRVGEPPEVVGGVLYLVSDLASFTSGSILQIDGGEA